jgi:hypothetical protein
VACLVAATASVTWCVSGIGRYHGPDHLIGPYAVPRAAEYAVGAAAVAGGLVAVGTQLLHPSRRRGIGTGALLLVVLTAGFVTVAWRIFTAGGDGANIGAGLLAMGGPFVVAGLLHAAVAAERRSREGMVHYRRFVVLAWTAGALLGALAWSA